MNILQEISFLENEIQELDPLVRKIIKDNRGQILTMIKLRLFNYGIDGDGNQILPDYTYSTIATKKRKRQRTSFVTLRDTGEFYGSFSVVYENEEISIQSSSDKAGALTSKYGNSILELTQDELTVILQGIIIPEIEKRINSSRQITIDF
jgi:hypothetical protein